MPTNQQHSSSDNESTMPVSMETLSQTHAEMVWSRFPDLRNQVQPESEHSEIAQVDEPKVPELKIPELKPADDSRQRPNPSALYKAVLETTANERDSADENADQSSKSEDAKAVLIESQKTLVTKMVGKLKSSPRLVLVVVVLVGLGIFAIVHDPAKNVNPANNGSDNQTTAPLINQDVAKKDNDTAPKWDHQTPPLLKPNAELAHGQTPSDNNQQPIKVADHNHHWANKKAPLFTAPKVDENAKQSNPYPTTNVQTQTQNLPDDIARRIGLPKNGNQSQQPSHQRYPQKPAGNQPQFKEPMLKNGQGSINTNPYVNTNHPTPGSAQFQGGVIIDNPNIRVTHEPTRPSIHSGLRR